MTFQSVARVDDIPDGSGKTVDIDGKLIAVFNLGGEFYAIENVCPHRGGSLGDGTIYEGAVICPDHSYQFDIKTGNPFGFPNGVKTFKTKVENGTVFVDIV